MKGPIKDRLVRFGLGETIRSHPLLSDHRRAVDAFLRRAETG